MARYVLPVAGAIVGAFFGNPQLGWAIGSALGAAVDPVTVRGPSIGDLIEQTSQEGGPRPTIYGLSPPIGGNIIASSEPKIIVRRKRVGGMFGTKVRTEHVFRTYAIGVCEGPVVFEKIWRNGKLVFDGSFPDFPNGANVSKREILEFAAATDPRVLFSRHARLFNGTFDQDPSPDLETIFGVGTTPAHRGTAYLVMVDEELTDLAGAIPQYSFQVRREYPDAPSSGTWPLSAVVADICARANLPAEVVDVSALSGEVRGFATINRYPAAASLNALSEIFMFDPVSHEGKIRFVPRGGNSVATITEADMVEDDTEIDDESQRMDAIQIPRVLHLNYHDVEGDLATAKQSSERAGDRRSKGEVSIQSPVVMSADEAARAVDINHKVSVENQKGELRFSLPDSWLRITAADPVIVQWQGRSERARIGKCEVHDGFQSYIALRDRQSAYTSDVEGIPPPPPTVIPLTDVGPSLIEAIDLALLRDTDDRSGLGFYIALSGLVQAWVGALVEFSIDGGATWFDDAYLQSSAVMGETLSVLPDHPQAYPDQINTVQVRIDTPLAELLETDLTGLLNGENLAIIGNEIIQFASAQEISDGVWELSYFLRGRSGTETQQQDAGARFMLIDPSALLFVPAEVVWLGREITLRATSIGATQSEPTLTSLTFQSAVQRERAVHGLTASLDGSTLQVSWIGVGRLGAGVHAAHGSYFLAYRITITDGMTTQVHETRDAQQLTVDAAVFSLPITVTVVQVNRLTGAGPASEVIIT